MANNERIIESIKLEADKVKEQSWIKEIPYQDNICYCVTEGRQLVVTNIDSLPLDFDWCLVKFKYYYRNGWGYYDDRYDYAFFGQDGAVCHDMKVGDWELSYLDANNCLQAKKNGSIWFDCEGDTIEAKVVYLLKFLPLADFCTSGESICAVKEIFKNHPSVTSIEEVYNLLAEKYFKLKNVLNQAVKVVEQ